MGHFFIGLGLVFGAVVGILLFAYRKKYNPTNIFLALALACISLALGIIRMSAE